MISVVTLTGQGLLSLPELPSDFIYCHLFVTWTKPPNRARSLKHWSRQGRDTQADRQEQPRSEELCGAQGMHFARRLTRLPKTQKRKEHQQETQHKWQQNLEEPESDGTDTKTGTQSARREHQHPPVPSRPKTKAPVTKPPKTP